MVLTSVVLLIVCIALTAFAAMDVLRQQRQVDRLESELLRQQAYRAERARFLASREVLASASDLAGDVVSIPAAVTRLGHDAIAAIPYTVLENVPVTAETSKLVREIHDEIASAVFDVLEGATKGLTGLIRKGLTGSTGPRPGPATQPDALERAAEDIAERARPEPDDRA